MRYYTSELPIWDLFGVYPTFSLYEVWPMYGTKDSKRAVKANNVRRAAIERNHARPRVKLTKRK